MKKILLIISTLFLISNINYSYWDNKLYDEINPENVYVSENWNDILYIGKREWKFYIVHNWIESNYSDVSPRSNIAVSKDFSKYTYIRTVDWKRIIIENWVEKKYCKDSWGIINLNYYDWNLLVKCDESMVNLFNPQSESKTYFYDWQKINNNEYSKLYKLSKQNNYKRCKYTSSLWTKDENWLYSILEDWEVIKTFKNRVSVTCYNNWNSYYYRYSDKPTFKTDYDNSDSSVIYTLIINWKEYKTQGLSNLQDIKFYSKWTQTALVIPDLNSEFSSSLYVNGKLVKKLGKYNYFHDRFIFSPNWDWYMFSTNENDINVFYKDWRELIRSKNIAWYNFFYSKNWSYFYILDSKLYKNWIEQSDDKVSKFKINSLNWEKVENYFIFNKDSKFYISSINNLSLYKNNEIKVKNEELTDNEKALIIIKEKAEKIKQQIYSKYWEEKLKESISNLYLKNPEKVKKIRKNINNKMNDVIDNSNLTQNQKLTQISKYHALSTIFWEAMDESWRDVIDTLEEAFGFKLF